MVVDSSNKLREWTFLESNLKSTEERNECKKLFTKKNKTKVNQKRGSSTWVVKTCWSEDCLPCCCLQKNGWSNEIKRLVFVFWMTFWMRWACSLSYLMIHLFASQASEDIKPCLVLWTSGCWSFFFGWLHVFWIVVVGKFKKNKKQKQESKKGWKL